jgi:phosphoenolpyruvate carboxylase
LRDDVRLLGELLGETLRRQESPARFERVERVRAHAKARRGRETGAADAAGPDALAAELGSLTIDEAERVARAFAHFLNLANIAEQHHRVRRRRVYQRDPQAPPQPASIDEALPRLLARGVAPAVLHDAVCRLEVELVVTAHPTEIMRRTLQQKYNRIARALAERDRPDLTPHERGELSAALRREITSAWETEDVRHVRPSPIDEVRSALTVLEQTLWPVVPEFLRGLDRALRQTVGDGLPLDAAPIRFGSWIGGDRDGNPHVTPGVTRRACLMARWTAADLWSREVDQLRSELSMADADDAVRARAGDAPEPYRAVLRALHQRLEATRAWLTTQLTAGDTELPDAGRLAAPGRIAATADLVEPLRLCHDSLVRTGNQIIADGRLADLLRRAAVFGVTLVRLDIRQEASRHAEAVEAMARARGDQYLNRPEPERLRFLLDALAAPPAPLPAAFAPSPEVADVFDTFRTIGELDRESLGAYVITRASRMSDVLAVAVLQHQTRVAQPLRIVPLFEVATDLERAGEVMRRLFAEPRYRAWIGRTGGRQEVMIGYSDSTKDVGRLAAAWALYRAQEAITGAGRHGGVPITLFHGRGGSVGRGGGPTWLAIQSQPPGSVDGRLRVTEQGEMIQAKFGLPGIALRTLEVYATATLEATVAPTPPPAPVWREMMTRLADVSARTFRRTVHDDPRCLEYFRAATPEAEFDALQIGSRPARRAGRAELAALRAIPWQFGWMQTRLLAGSWLGVEELGGSGMSDADLACCRTMYREWAFFRSLIDLTAMALAKADAGIAAHYDRVLVPADLQPVGEALRARLVAATAAILAITRESRLLENNHVLRRSIDVRNPYVDPLHLIQVELLRRLRSMSAPAPEEERARLRRALLITMNGVAAGMRNTG